MQTKRVRERLKRKHPRSDELLGNVQRWAMSLGLDRRASTPAPDDEAASGSLELPVRIERKKLEV